MFAVGGEYCLCFSIFTDKEYAKNRNKYDADVHYSIINRLKLRLSFMVDFWLMFFEVSLIVFLNQQN